MSRFVARRLAFTLVIIWLVSIVTFGATHVLPGDVATAILGQNVATTDVQQLRRDLGLDRPLVVQYGDWLGGAVRGDFGEARTYQVPVGPLVWDRLKRSLLLAGLAFAVAIPIAILLGSAAALWRDRAGDHTISVTTLTAVSLPEFVSGTILILIFSSWLELLPPTSLRLPGTSFIESTKELALPVATLCLVLLAHTARMTRISMIEALESQYVRTAVLKGLSRRRVVVRHALPNALLPTVTLIALGAGWLIAGLVVVENVFGYAGIGRLLLEAIEQRDIAVIQAVTVVVAAIYACSNLLADVLYARLDPRIRWSDLDRA
jgi:peptide/nickel transport system permease protein